MEPKDDPYKRPGPHMWKLLFAQREYMPPSRAWHLWHLFVAVAPAAAVAYGMQRVRRRMQVGGLWLETALLALEYDALLAEDAVKAEVTVVAEQLATLKQDVERLKALTAASPVLGPAPVVVTATPPPTAHAQQ